MYYTVIFKILEIENHRTQKSVNTTGHSSETPKMTSQKDTIRHYRIVYDVYRNQTENYLKIWHPHIISLNIRNNL
jgi:hypothetical protein